MIDVKNDDIETPEMVAEHIRKALKVLPPERIFILPDCGCFHLPRDVAFAKLKAMVEGTRIVRKELGKVASNMAAAESNSGSAHQRPFLLHGGNGGQRLTPEAKLCEIASDLAQIPGVVAAGITSYAGGSAGHDPIRVADGVRARGLTPNIHLTCVNHDPAGCSQVRSTT